MNDVRKEGSRKPDPLKIALVGVALIGVAALVYVMVAASFKPKAPNDLIDLRRGALAKLEVPGHPKPRNPRAPDIDPGVSPPGAPPPADEFRDAAGRPVRIADFKGKVAIVNIWATWCAPCKVEMPTLARLQAAYAAQPVEVVALSIDRPDAEQAAREEIARNAPLKLYLAGGSGISFKFTPPAAGVPATIIYDRKGIERARVSGDADWNSPEARELVERLLKEG